MPRKKSERTEIAKLPAPIDSEETELSRRYFLFGLAAAGALVVPMLSPPAKAAVSMLRSGIDPDAVASEVIPAKKGGGRGGGGRGRGGGGHGRGRGGGGHGRGKGHSRGHKGRGHGGGRGRSYNYRYSGRRRYGRGGYYGGYYGGCYNPWYRRRYWYRCTGVWF